MKNNLRTRKCYLKKEIRSWIPSFFAKNPTINLKFVLFISFIITNYHSFSYVNDLRARGYSLIPAPQETKLTSQDVKIDDSWKVTSNVASANPARRTFIEGAKKLLDIDFKSEVGREIILDISNQIIDYKINKELYKQGYRIEIKDTLVRITGNGEAGLFYGVQSLLQLLRPSSNGKFTLPEGTITDWPDLELRMVHWDTKHHQDRMETLKRYMDQSAYFKVNAITFEIEDKYEYPSHPIIGAPGAFTKAQMHELSAYALERHIQLIPVIQSPAHMAYVLKHKEFAHLRADEMNYQACMCNEEAIELIFDMYQDIIEATPGMDYFYVSTDEVYYAGICGKCKKEYNNVTRSQKWVDFVNRAYEWLKERDRKMMAWVEYPLLLEDITKLPHGLLGPIRDEEPKEWIDKLKQAGVKQFAYSSMQGNEFLFPNYFQTKFRGKQIKGRLEDAAKTVPATIVNGAELVGTFAAAWDDAGLHNETFWLGWATVTQYAWSIGKPEIHQSNADFVDAFYGYNAPNMIEVYTQLQQGARFYEDLWDQVISKERASGYGSSRGKGIGVDRFDYTLEAPPLPSQGDIVMFPKFRERYGQKIKEASILIEKNDQLMSLLQQALTRVARNRYNIEVLLSLAYLERHAMTTLLNMAKLEDILIQASNARLDFPRVIGQLLEAYHLAGEMLEEEKDMWNRFTIVWEKSQFPKCRSVNGKEFVHVLDDVKDHFADRRLGLDYMLAPFERIGLKEWQKKLGVIIQRYAEAKKIPVKGFEIERLED